MNQKQLFNQLKLFIEKGVKKPILIQGESGIGKSEIVHQVGEAIVWDVVDLRLALQESTDIVGMPRVDDITKRMVWYAPEWVPENGKPTILFFDEINRGQVDVRQAIFQCLTDYKIHMKQFDKPNVYIVAAMNPSDKYQVEELCPAMTSRLCVLDLVPDVESWLEWARLNKVNDTVVRFLAVNQSLLLQPKEQGQFPCPRAWTSIGDQLDKEALIPELLAEMTSGQVGREAAVVFKRWYDKEFDAPISGKQILEDYHKISKEVKKQTREGKDRTNSTIRDLVALISADPKLLNRQGKINVIEFALDLPQEIKYGFLQKLIGTDAIRILGSDNRIAEAVKGINSEVVAA